MLSPRRFDPRAREGRDLPADNMNVGHEKATHPSEGTSQARAGG
jgi:hypothetical protein